MEISFEIIREAGLRVPSPLGSTVGIVGTIILGQAAVDADIVSPILVIVIAITGITSFAITNFTFSFHFRICRFVYTILGALGGFFGIAIGLFIHSIMLCSLRSFGASYLAPYAPANLCSSNKFSVRPAWKREFRPDFLGSQKPKAQSHFVEKWRKNFNK